MSFCVLKDDCLFTSVVWIARCREKARTKDKNAGGRAVETRSIAAAQRAWYDNGIIQCMISCDYGERG